MEIARQFAGVAFVLALLGAALWLLRHYGLAIQTRKARPGAGLEILEQVSLGPGHRLHLVRVAGRAVLIATHASGSTLLDSLPAHEVQCDPVREGRQ